MLKLKQTFLIAILSGVSLLSVNTLANAAAPGFYVGGQAGWGDTHYNGDFDKIKAGFEKDGILVQSFSKKDSGIAGRLFTGYQFNQNLALELGYIKFSDALAKYGFGSAGHMTNRVKQYAVDFTGKGILPLQDGFSVYGKAGVAWLRGALNSTSVNMNGDAYVYKNAENKYLPTFGAGAIYDLCKNASVSIGWDHIQSMSIAKHLRNTDLVAMSLGYKFD